MKLLSYRNNASGTLRRGVLAMTLVEMMTAMVIFLMMMGGMISLHIFGLRYDQMTGSKLGASDQARVSFDKLLGDVRSAKTIQIGTNYSGSNFVAVPSGAGLIGTAMRLGFAHSTNIVVYYLDPANNRLFRSTNGVAGGDVIAAYLTNGIKFRGEDYLGNLLSALDNHSVVDVKMEFYQYQYPLTKVGSNFLYDYYKLEFKASSRNYD